MEGEPTSKGNQDAVTGADAKKIADAINAQIAQLEADAKQVRELQSGIDTTVAGNAADQKTQTPRDQAERIDPDKKGK